MRTRIISALALVPIVISIVYLGGDILRFTLMILSLTALHEFYKAINGKHLNINYISYAFTIIYYLMLGRDIKNFSVPMILFMVYTLVLFCYLVLNYPKHNINTISITSIGVMYIPILFSYVYTIRMMHYGIYFVWLVFITAFATDTFAYFSGVFLGKTKLTPTLSPNKTIEGSVGGILGCIVCCILFCIFINSSLGFKITHIIIGSFLIGFCCSIFAQFGDLSASSIKRHTGVKDFGKIIPGHGGILDRFDSILFTAPMLYIILELLV